MKRLIQAVLNKLLKNNQPTGAHSEVKKNIADMLKKACIPEVPLV